MAFSVLKSLLLAIASLGYFANGALAHVHIEAGETLHLQMCGVGSNTTITLDVPGNPVEATEETCCGECTHYPAAEVQAPLMFADLPRAQPKIGDRPRYAIFPRSPLWPGAPPVGPPTSLNF